MYINIIYIFKTSITFVWLSVHGKASWSVEFIPACRQRSEQRGLRAHSRTTGKISAFIRGFQLQCSRLIHILCLKPIKA